MQYTSEIEELCAKNNWKRMHKLDFLAGSREETWDGFSTEFPYVSICTEPYLYEGHVVPWHWHKSVELFYMEKGTLEYNTPGGKYIFPEGSGGFVNSNVLHMTKTQCEDTVQLIHIFEPVFISGRQNSEIDRKYIQPLTTAPGLWLIALEPENPVHGRILNKIRQAFEIPVQEFGYELKLREALSEIWLSLYEIAAPLTKKAVAGCRTNDKVKMMMTYIHEHYADKITIPGLAEAGYTSVRDCYRVFQECLHMTPVEYITDYRIQMACYLLASTDEPVTAVGRACGLGSSSYFGSTFRRHIGMTPLEYRMKWHNTDI